MFDFEYLNKPTSLFVPSLAFLAVIALFAPCQECCDLFLSD